MIIKYDESQEKLVRKLLENKDLVIGLDVAEGKDKWLTFKNPKIRIGTGRPEWGAEPGKNYFVITWSE